MQLSNPTSLKQKAAKLHDLHHTNLAAGGEGAYTNPQG